MKNGTGLCSALVFILRLQVKVAEGGKAGGRSSKWQVMVSLSAFTPVLILSPHIQ